ncbi:hypothetical protein [Amaricoccus solimangrovi]|uniref:Solute-binding protein family 3/N-terminal domain-containing protein n=1 Tax=Amaricoccus solimangrovi TaxID=2589815 RepID=A0A501WX50_9RHOB|nr:hypothetical protein [Amaricoccus solimangrovi]TPE53030.1 hypothetical protein FJM51_03110 [Amaricoccus solimangrovi]
MADVWPDNVPTSLWTYQTLELKTVPEVPMMGLVFANGFLLAAGLGAVFLLIFARQRFMEQQRNGGPDENFLVLTEIEAQDLGGSSALRKAYMIYASVILIIYLGLTFFGKLIFSLTKQLPVAGIDVDLNQIRFDQPAWPLTVAFGLAGMGPLLPPVRIAEDWLRERAYRAVGIPTRIQKTARKIVAALDHASSEEPAERTGRKRKIDRDAWKKNRALRKLLADKRELLRTRLSGTWMDAALGRADRRDEFIALHTQLESLVFWARGARGAWPGIEVSEAVRSLENRVLEETEVFLNEFERNLREARSGGSPPVIPAFSPKLKQMRRLRGELAAILAVFVERDPIQIEKDGAVATERGASEIRDAALDGLLLASEPSPVTAGPELALGLAILCLFPVYAVFVWRGWHPAFAPASSIDAPVTILTSAALETLRLTLILWLPIMAAFSVRQYLIDEDRWIYDLGRGYDSTQVLREQTAAIMVGLVAAFIGLLALAPLWAFLQSINEARFRDLLLKGTVPFLLFYPSMLIISAPAVWSALAGADARARRRWKRGMFLGLVGAGFVFAAQYLQLGLWYGFQACAAKGWFLFDFWQQEGCFANYGGLDFVVYPLLTFLTTVFLGNPERRTRRQLRRTAQASLRPASAATTALLLVLAPLAFSAMPALSQTTGTPAVSPAPGREPPKEPMRVTLGFRTDAEPFSFKSDNNKDDSDGFRYSGFVADLCHRIFSGPGFIVTETAVTAEDRFERLRKHENDPDKIDVLCDPVTMRYSDPERVGLYSPIVFASGVSYLRVLQRAAGARVQIAYVEGSTSDKVARRACDVDLFAIVPPKKRDTLPIICATSWSIARYVYARGNAGGDDDLDALASGLALAADLQLRWAKTQLGATDAASACPGDGSSQCVEILRKLADNFEADPGGRDDTLRTRSSALRVDLEAAVGKRRSDELFDLWKGVHVWQSIRDELTSGDRCVSDACFEQLRSEFLSLGYDPDCGVVDNYGATRFERIYYRFCPLRSHNDAISWLCSPRFNADTNLVYMGDRDIIVGKLRSWNILNGDCPVENTDGADILTYEPYALLFRKDPELADVIQRGVYDFFSRRTDAQASFATYFPGKTMSTVLAYLFLLNAVEQEETTTSRSVPIPEARPGPAD